MDRVSGSTYVPDRTAPPRVEEVSAGVYAYIQPDGSHLTVSTST